MKLFFSILFIFLGFFSFSQKQKKNIPNEVRKFVVKGYEVYDYVQGDINNDKKKDAILILKHKLQGSYDSIKDEYVEKQLPFIILLRNNSNQLYKFLRTDSLVPILVTPTYYGDLEIDTLKHDRFKISFWGGRRCKWYIDLVFQFNKKLNRFYLVEKTNSGACSGDSTSDFEYVIKADELKNISLDKFNYDSDEYENYDRGIINMDTIWVYSNPDFNAPKLQYMIKGKEVYVGMQTKNFIEITEFGEENEKRIKGFVLKKDIKLYK